jgi:hypothetical protein
LISRTRLGEQERIVARARPSSYLAERRPHANVNTADTRSAARRQAESLGLAAAPLIQRRRFFVKCGENRIKKQLGVNGEFLSTRGRINRTLTGGGF